MRSFFVCLRIILVGVLWGIVFTEGIRVIMLCNWHFDIFWPDHWRQAKELWQAGWVVRAPKEWAFVIILATFFPMLITGWWTLSLVAWERIIYQILLLPVSLYRYFIKKPINVITTNNKYGVVKRKSYKQIRPTGIIGSIRSPISDYNDSSRSSATTAASSYTPAKTPSYAVSSGTSSYIGSAYNNTPKPAAKTDVAATIDHALFKFDDDDDDFDLDIDSFEKTNITKKRDVETKPKQNNKRKFEDAFADDFDEDDFDNAPVRNKRDNRRNKAKMDDDEDDEFETPSKRTKSARQEKGGERTERSEYSKEDKDSTKNNKRGNKSGRDESNEDNIATVKKDNTHGPVYDALQQKGYNIISNIAVGGDTTIDFIGVDEGKICLCMVDKENGDWLADEELFNGEEPLWFSENSHRVSPVRKLKIARDAVKEKLQEEGFELNLQAFVVVQMANIINADDMFDVWDDMDIKVTRINRGAPKEIALFSKTLSEAEGTLPRQEMDKLRKTLKSLK